MENIAEVETASVTTFSYTECVEFTILTFVCVTFVVMKVFVVAANVKVLYCKTSSKISFCLMHYSHIKYFFGVIV